MNVSYECVCIHFFDIRLYLILYSPKRGKQIELLGSHVIGPVTLYRDKLSRFLFYFL